MVKFHESSFSHDYPFPTVTLAYFLRYPNPFATHVLASDVIDRHYDPETQTLYTARIHLKRSKVPSTILKLVPRSWLGATPSGTSQSYILERSVVDVKAGVMVTESRNLELTRILAVVERQLYKRPQVDLGRYFRSTYDPPLGYRLTPPGNFEQQQAEVRFGGYGKDTSEPDDEEKSANDAVTTDVLTKVELISRVGQAAGARIRNRWGSSSTTKTEAETPSETTTEEEPQQKMGFFRSWSTSSIQKSIEAIGLRRTESAVPNSKHGMNIVLDRLRKGGLVAVFEGMKRDREGGEVTV